MRRIHRYCLQITAIIAGSAMIALPAAAMDRNVSKVCRDFFENHINEPDWEQACAEALQQRKPQPPPAIAPAAIAPALVVSDHSSNDGDRDSILQILQSGESADILIEFEARDVRVEANALAIAKGLRSLSEDELAYKRSGYATVKQVGLAGLQGVTILRDYENLTSSFARVSNEAALNALLARPEVRAVYENRPLQHALNESLPLVEQPAAAAAGLEGAGTTIAVLDTGVNFTIAPFNCTSPGIPAGCRVVATFEAAANDFSLDDIGHGTNVSAIAASTAGDADIVVADVFAPGGGAFPSDIQAAISWAIAIQATFNIVSMNLSLQDNSRNLVQCPENVLAASLSDALAAGIQPIIASGNTAFVTGSFEDGISGPACVPAAVSVAEPVNDSETLELRI